MMRSMRRRFSQLAHRNWHPRFLRENTQESFDASSCQRLPFGLPADIRVEAAASSAEGGERLTFSDGHVGHLQLPPAAPRRLGELPRSLWGPEAAELLRPGGPLRFRWQKMADKQAERRRWIHAMHEHGVTVVDTPEHEEFSLHFAEVMVGYALPTVYGVHFKIRAEHEPNNLAYSNVGLQMHTDLPFYRTPPGIELFHCLRPADVGGESLFLDGFALARDFQVAEPSAYELLRREPVQFFDQTRQWHLVATHPIFRHTDSGELERVCFNERTRDSWADVTGACQTEARAAEFYRAMESLERFVEDRSRYITVPLHASEMVCFDNWRVMHSRNAFGGARYFEGVYLDWCATEGAWRV